MIILRIDTNKLVDHGLIPKKNKAEFLFYELIVYNGTRAIARIMFKVGQPDLIDIRLFAPEEYTKYYYRREANAYRLVDLDKAISIFINKVYLHDRGEVKVKSNHGIELVDMLLLKTRYHTGLIRHLPEDSINVSEIGITFFMWNQIKFGQSYKLVGDGSIVAVQDSETIVKKKGLDEIFVNKWHTSIWEINKLFYESTRCTQNMMVQNIIYHNMMALIFKPLKDQSLPIMDLVDVIHFAFKWQISYMNDFSFTNPEKITDHNDELVEMSYFGDCEDFSHMYLRCFYTVLSCYKLVLEETDPLYKSFLELDNNYIPMSFICRIMNVKKEFHSTMLLVPKNEEYKPIIFEVTNENITGTFTQDSKLYTKYVNFHALIDNNYISVFKKDNKKSLDELVFDVEDFSNY